MKPIDCSAEDMKSRVARHDDYVGDATSYTRLNTLCTSIFGGSITSLMAHPATVGRFADPRIVSPKCGTVGYLAMKAGAGSLAYQNPDFIEFFMCLSGRLRIDFGGGHSVTLDKDDVVRVPIGVQHSIHNDRSDGATIALVFANGPADCTFSSIVAGLGPDSDDTDLLAKLGVRAGPPGADLAPGELDKSVARCAALRPYKHSLSGAGLPPEAVEYLTASSVYPIMVPEKYEGRQRHAPLRGLTGLNLSIAECTPNDGPLPHAHSQTQESFFALEGEWDVPCGNEMSCVVRLNQHDLVAMPVMAMRAFRNVGAETARLLVIIQQDQTNMTDVVAYTPEVGAEVRRRYSDRVLEAFEETNFAFDAEP